MNRQLIDELSKLSHQLQLAENLTEHDQRLVEQLQKDIRSLLHHPGNGPAFRTLDEQLVRAIDRLEISHPELTAVMGRVIDSLSTMGI